MGKKKASRPTTAKKAAAKQPVKNKVSKKAATGKPEAKGKSAAAKPIAKKQRTAATKTMPAAFKNPDTPSTQPAGRSREEWISELAYFKWQSAGCPHGDGANFWAEAEADYVAMYG